MKHVIFFLFISLLQSKLTKKELSPLKTQKIPESKKVETNLENYNDKELYEDPSLAQVENDFEQALELKKADSPVAISPEVVKGLITSLKDLENKTDDGMTDDHINGEPIYQNNWDIKESDKLIKDIEERKKQYNDLRKNIEDLKKQLELLQQKKEDEKRDCEILEIEEKLKNLRDELKDLRGKVKGPEEEVDELTLKIQKIETDLLNLEDKKEEILKEIQNLKDIFNQKEREKKEKELEKIEELINDLIEEKKNLEEIQKDEIKHEELEQEIIDLEKEEINVKNDDHDILVKKLDELIQQEKNLADKQKIEEAISELDNKIFDTDDEEKKNELIQKRFDLIRKMREIEEENKPKIDSIELKQKLNVRVNPMFHNLSPVLDKDYADTSDFGKVIADVNNYRRINNVISDLNQIQDIFDELFKNIPGSKKKLEIKKNTSEEGIVILQQTEIFFKEFENQKYRLFKLINHFEHTFESLKTEKKDILEYFNLKEEFETVEKMAANSKNNNVEEYLEFFELVLEDFRKDLKKIIDKVKSLKDIIKKLEDKIEDFQNKMKEVDGKEKDSEEKEKDSEEKEELLVEEVTKYVEPTEEKTELTEEKIESTDGKRRRKLYKRKRILLKKNKLFQRRNKYKNYRILKEEEAVKDEIIDKEMSRIDLCKENLPDIIKIKEEFDDNIGDLMNLLKVVKGLKFKINEKMTELEIELKKPIDKHGEVLESEKEYSFIHKIAFVFVILLF